MKIKLGRQAERKKNDLSEEEDKCVTEFLSCADVTYTTTERMANVYLDMSKKYIFSFFWTFSHTFIKGNLECLSNS